MAASPIILPIVTIQPDFLTVVADIQEGTVPEEDFWVSCYKTGETSVHGKVRVNKGERGVEWTSRLGVQLEHDTSVSSPACLIDGTENLKYGGVFHRRDIQWLVQNWLYRRRELNFHVKSSEIIDIQTHSMYVPATLLREKADRL